MPSLGDEFRVAREARGLSLSDVAEHLHIRSNYLQAIEEEDWAAIGAPVYIRGFIRTYARFLGIDPEHAIEAFNATVPSAPPTKQWSGANVSGAQSEGRPSIMLWVAAVLALGLVGYVGYGYYQLKTGGTDSPRMNTGIPIAVASATASAVSVPSATAQTATPVPSPTRQSVSLKLTQLSWLRVNVDGNVVLEGEFPPGTSREFRGKHVRLLVGNAGGVEVSAPGQPERILGSPGQVVERDYFLTGKTE